MVSIYIVQMQTYVLNLLCSSSKLMPVKLREISRVKETMRFEKALAVSEWRQRDRLSCWDITLTVADWGCQNDRRSGTNEWWTTGPSPDIIFHEAGSCTRCQRSPAMSASFSRPQPQHRLYLAAITQNVKLRSGTKASDINKQTTDSGPWTHCT